MDNPYRKRQVFMHLPEVREFTYWMANSKKKILMLSVGEDLAKRIFSCIIGRDANCYQTFWKDGENLSPLKSAYFFHLFFFAYFYFE